MEFTYTQTFEASAESMLKMLTDTDYHAAHQAAIGCTDFEIIDTHNDNRQFYLKCRFMTVSEVALPGFVKKFLGERQQINQEESWDKNAHTGSIEILIPGLPGHVRCAVLVRDTELGSAKIFNWDVKVKVPIIGSKIEKFMRDDIERKIDPDIRDARERVKQYA